VWWCLWLLFWQCDEEEARRDWEVYGNPTRTRELRRTREQEANAHA
jgi:hypothetical protein